MTSKFFGGLLLTSMGLSGCQAPPGPVFRPTPTASVTPTVAATPAGPLVAATGNAFAWASTRNVLSKRSQVFSPFSLREALALLHLGAAGQTSQALARLCGFGADFVREHESQSSSLRALEPSVVWRSQDALFVARNFQLQPDYQKTAQRAFAARAESVDFADVNTVRLINEWVAKQTEYKIKKLLSDLPSDTRAVLASAVYLKATWQHKFDKQRTRPQPFFDGTARTRVPTMNRTGSYRLYQAKGWRMLELPYSGGRLVFDCVLPDKPDGLPGVLQALDWETLQSSLRALELAPSVDLSLPRFKTESEFQLLSTLREMGLPATGDYSRLSRESLAMTGVVQKAFIEVDETGTEAAAATASALGGGAPPKTVKFAADRPFLYLIRDTQTEAILFTGQVYKP